MSTSYCQKTENLGKQPFKYKIPDKQTLLLKPGQSGKTFHVLNNILDVFRSNGKKRTINIIYCDNSLLQTMQTTKRLENKKELDIFKDSDGNLSLVLSSKSKCKSLGDLAWAITESNYRNVVCCNNRTQLNTINQLITSNTYSLYNFNIYIDEADKFISSNQRYLSEWDTVDNVRQIMLITATPERLFKVYPQINLIKLQHSVDKTIYHRFADCLFEFWNVDSKPVPYAKSILENNKHILQPGQVWYVPAETTRKSHDNMEKLLLSMNMVVVKINGVEKTLCRKQGDVIDLTRWVEEGKRMFAEEEMSVWLGKLYQKYNLQDSILAITGNLCVGRGLTLSSKDVMITHAILSSYPEKSEQYQIAARLCGNTKLLDIYKKPVVFCSKNTQLSVLDMETKAEKIPETAYKNDISILTKHVYKIGGDNKVSSGVPVLLKLSEEAMMMINKHRKAVGVNKNMIHTELLNCTVFNKNDDFDMEKYSLMNIQRVERHDVSITGLSKYRTEQFHDKYQFQQLQEPDVNCKQKGQYNILVVMDDIPYYIKRGINKGDAYITYVPL